MQERGTEDELFGWEASPLLASCSLDVSKRQFGKHVAGSSRALGQFPGAATYILAQPREDFASQGFPECTVRYGPAAIC